MTGESNEGVERHGHGKQEEELSRDEEPTQEKEDTTPLTKAATSKGKNKGGSDRSEPVDDDSDKNGNIPLPFPQRMMNMLSDERYSNVVCWLPHGKGFVIIDKKRFSNEVIPKYFSRKAKFTSFTRKLNRWSFTRVTRGPENGAYYHPLFQKNNFRLCTRMSCIDSKAPQAIQPMNPVALGLTASPFAQTDMMLEASNSTRVSRIDSKAPQAIQQMNPVTLGLAAIPFTQMNMMRVDPSNLNTFPQDPYASDSLSREWGFLPHFLPTGQPPTNYANELHTFQGTPGQGDSTYVSCYARACGEPVRADEHDDDDIISEQSSLDGFTL